jgi:hypoxanthine phosphoribosyltransferase
MANELYQGVRPLFTADQLAVRIKELGTQISDEYAGKNPMLVCILKGSMLFYADLTRAIDTPHTWDIMRVSSYHGGTSSSGVVKVNTDLSSPLEGRHVILVEDIVDSGRTMSHLVALLGTRNPASLKVATLLDKPSRREVPVDIHYCGFSIPDEFVVGYGLDYGQFFRQLPFVGVMGEIPRLPLNLE